MAHNLVRSTSAGSNMLRSTGAGWNMLRDKNRRLRSALHKGDFSLAEACLKKGCDIEQADGDSFTPLLIAARWGQLQICQLLIEHYGANATAQTCNGDTALDLAAANGHDGVVAYLRDRCGSQSVRSRAASSPALSVSEQNDSNNNSSLDQKARSPPEGRARRSSLEFDASDPDSPGVLDPAAAELEKRTLWVGVAIDETVILLTLSLFLTIDTPTKGRGGCQQNDSLAGG